MLRRVLLAGLAMVSFSSMVHAGPVTTVPQEPAYDPVKHWEFDLETGALWSVGHNASPLNYVILPQMLTFKSPAVLQGGLWGGDLVLRNRFSLLIEPIIEGPESYFIGANASGILEWWNPSRSFNLFFSAGGGLGVMDSKGYEVEGGQGQDLNFTYFAYTGARLRVCERGSLALGLYYQHISNTDLDDINPGIDSLGPMLSFGWHF